jgi:P-type Cu+ transporter
LAVDVSIVTQTITVRHSQQLTPDVINDTLDDAGFDIITTPVGRPRQNSLSESISRLQPTLSRKHLKHLQHCPQCQSEQQASAVPRTERDKFGEDTLVEELPQLKRSASPSLDALSEGKLEESSDSASLAAPPSCLPGPYHVTLSVGGMTCAACTNTLTGLLGGLDGISDAVINLLANSATFTADNQNRVPLVVQAIEDAGYEADVISVDPIKAPPRREPSRGEHDGPFRLTLSVGGMTCAACSNTVTGIASDISGVSEVAVSLIGKSATAVIVRKELADQLKEAIEDAGFEAEVITLEPIRSTDDYATGPRNIALQIEGMFCA